MTKIKNSCVMITGGASGIGRIMGRMALEKGARQVVIWDINEQNIAATIADFEKIGVAKGFCVDVSWFDTIVGRWLGIYSTMDHFKGRK